MVALMRRPRQPRPVCNCGAREETDDLSFWVCYCLECDATPISVPTYRMGGTVNGAGMGSSDVPACKQLDMQEPNNAEFYEARTRLPSSASTLGETGVYFGSENSGVCSPKGGVAQTALAMLPLTRAAPSECPETPDATPTSATMAGSPAHALLQSRKEGGSHFMELCGPLLAPAPVPFETVGTSFNACWTPRPPKEKRPLTTGRRLPLMEGTSSSVKDEEGHAHRDCAPGASSC